MSKWKGAPARLVEAILSLSVLIVLAEALGSLAILTRATLLVSLVLLAAVAWSLSHDARKSGGATAAAPGWGWPIALAGAVAGIAVIHWAGGVQDSLSVGMYRQDSTWYHLPFAARIFQSGSTWALSFTDPMALTAWFYPQNAEVLHAAGMLVLGNDFLSPFLNLGWLSLALLAAWCVGRPFGHGAETLIGAALVLGTGMMQAQAGNAANDAAGVCLLLATVAVLVNGAATGGGRGVDGGRVLLVAGLGAGLAIGTKITLLAPVAVVTLGLAWTTRRDGLRPLAFWTGGVLATGGYWYLRNFAHAGNPLPWVSTGALPGPHQLSLYPRPPHSVADYAGNPSVWLHEFAPSLSNAIGPLWPLVLAAAAAGLVLAVIRGPGLDRILGLAGIAAAVAYVFVPVSASGAASHPSGFETNLRYLAPALVLGLVILPMQLGRLGIRSRLLAGGMALVFVIDAFTSWDWLPSALGVGMALALVLVGAVPAVSLARRSSTSALAVAGASAALLIVALGYPSQRDYARNRYRASAAPAADNPGFRDTPQWRRIQAWARNVHDARIGVVGPPGAFGQYLLYDWTLTNRVRYMGEPGPDGAFRPINRCSSWRRAINRERLGFVVVTPPSAFGAASTPQENLWMRGDQNATRILDAFPAAVYRIVGALDASDCNNAHLPPILAVPGGGVSVPPLR